MSWVAELVNENECFLVMIYDQSKTLIRQISELGLWELLESVDSETEKGNLISRVA